MSKYRPLERYLRSRKRRVELGFDEVEAILGSALPQSARRHAAWWSNSGGTHVQSHAWASAGYRTAGVDLKRARLVFEPVDDGEGFSEVKQATFIPKEAPKSPPPPAEATKKRHPAFGVWKGLVTLDPNYDYTQPADPDWGKVYED